MIKVFGIVFNRPSRWWIITSTIVIAFLLTLTILATTTFYALFNIVMPGGGTRLKYADGSEPIYQTETKSKAEALEKANAFNITMLEESMVLLKNKNNALPVKTPNSDASITLKPKVSVFGKNSTNLSYGGSGSGGGSTSDAKNIHDSLVSAGYEVNQTLEDFYKNDGLSGTKRAANSSDLDSGGNQMIATAETPQSRYTDAVKSSYNTYSDLAIIIFTRIGGEGFDLPRYQGTTTGATNPTDHYLQLDSNEIALVDAVTKGPFKKIIVVINSGAAMELGFLESSEYSDKIDAALLMGFPGSTGVMALGRILNGSVNPSGKTVDTYARDFKKDPTFVNFGDNNISGGDAYRSVDGSSNLLYYFVDYEEGIYVGYKYYETRGFTDGESWYQQNVVYPLGHGLSYTTFDWEIVNENTIDKEIKKDSKIKVEVKVTNTGAISGKEVVQLYVKTPYIQGQIEKSHVTLAGFSKTTLLEPGKSEILTIEFDPYSVASYDYNDKNGNGFKGYELDKGEYELLISKNAHVKNNTIKLNLPTNIQYSVDPVTGNKVENRYTGKDNLFNSNEQLDKVMSRSDWEATWPNTRTADERIITQELLNALMDRNHNNPNDYSNEEMPWSGEDVTIKLYDLLKNIETENKNEPLVSYDDPRWETILDQVKISDMINMYNYGAFKTDSILYIGKPKTNDTDGPAGFVNFMDKNTFYGTAYYASQSSIASSWDVSLLEKFGETVGEEGLWGNAKGDKAPYSGWYAPGVNLHRSPFGGRNFEYYSEDAFLSGKLAAAQIKGVQSKGVYVFVKHFAVNDQETHRSITGLVTWVDEQALRELYLKPFEYSVKEGNAYGMMSAFNRIGTRWTGGDYRLLTDILRDEWGFRGSVISDFNTVSYMNSRQMAYAGGDINLATLPVTWVDESDASDVIVLRNAVKNILYTVVNSNAMNGEVIGELMPYWQIALYTIDVLALIGLSTWGFFAIRKSKRLYNEKHASINA